MFLQLCISVELARVHDVIFTLADNLAAQYARLSYLLTSAHSVDSLLVSLQGCTHAFGLKNVADISSSWAVSGEEAPCEQCA